jgi:hypothetical protein
MVSDGAHRFVGVSKMSALTRPITALMWGFCQTAFG